MSGPKGARGAQGPPVSANQRVFFVNVDLETKYDKYFYDFCRVPQVSLEPQVELDLLVPM